MSCNSDIIVCGNCITVALVLVQANFEDIGRGEGGHKRHSGVWAHRFQENYGPLELQYKALATVISPWLFIIIYLEVYSQKALGLCNWKVEV